MLRRIAVTGFLLLSLLGPETQAHAQAPVAEETPRDRGVRLFQEAASHYRAGRFRVAVELLRESYELHPEPVVLFNLARSLEGLGELEEALESYSAFLEASPNAPDRGAVEARIETLERLVREQREREEAARAIAQSERERDEPEVPILPAEPDELDAGGIALTAVGAAGLLAGAIVSGVAVAKHNEWVDAPSHAAAVQSLAEARDIASAANVTFAIGGALALVGGIWLIVDGVDSGGETTETSSVRVGLGGDGMRLDVRW